MKRSTSKKKRQLGKGTLFANTASLPPRVSLPRAVASLTTLIRASYYYLYETD